MYILLHIIDEWKPDGEHVTRNVLVKADSIVAIEPHSTCSTLRFQSRGYMTVAESDGEITRKIEKASERQVR